MKKLLIVPAFIAIVAFGIWGTGKVMAVDNGDTSESIASRIARRFGLNEDDVQKFFSEVHQEKMMEHTQNLEERLMQAVKDGKITEQQKQAILAKFKELKDQHAANLEAFKDMTPQDRRDAMEKKRAELEVWAKEQGIDTNYLLGFGMGMKGVSADGRGMHGFGKGFGMAF